MQAPRLSGWLSTITLISFLGGLVLMNQGIIGIYIARIYDEAKKRPIYVVDRIISGARVQVDSQSRARALTHDEIWTTQTPEA